MKKRNQGFTLVEIMIVVAIIAILAAVAIPNFIKYRRNSQAAACVSNLKQIQAAVEQCKLAGKEVSSGNIYGSAGYIKAEPHCPSQTSVAYTLPSGDADPTCTFSDTDSTDTASWHKIDKSSTSTTP